MQEFEKLESLDPTSRGYEFERFLTRIFEREGIDFRGSYKPKGEQIDGAVFLHGRSYLIEARWRKKRESASSIYAFRGKIEGKLTGTLGIFWSITGYSDDCIDTVKAGKTLNVILFDRSDLEAIVNNEESFLALLEQKLKIAGRIGEMFLPWSLIMKKKKLEKEPPKLIVMVEGTYDNMILESLFDFVYDSEKVQSQVIMPGGKAKILAQSPIFATVLFSTPNTYLLVVMDRDYDTYESIEKLRDRLSDAAGSGKERLYLAAPDPTIWSWLGLDSSLPKPDLSEILKTFNWKSVIDKHEDLMALVTFLRQIYH
jgi:hypothetical protein